jgi:hypothetical protein
MKMTNETSSTDETSSIDVSVKKKAAAAQPVVETFDLTLTEFCLRLSTEKVGPEMIAGFQHSQNAKGVIKASSESFRSAFKRFVVQPA